jgi:hypothetical protein
MECNWLLLATAAFGTALTRKMHHLHHPPWASSLETYQLCACIALVSKLLASVALHLPQVLGLGAIAGEVADFLAVAASHGCGVTRLVALLGHVVGGTAVAAGAGFGRGALRRISDEVDAPDRVDSHRGRNDQLRCNCCTPRPQRNEARCTPSPCGPLVCSCGK